MVTRIDRRRFIKTAAAASASIALRTGSTFCLEDGRAEKQEKSRVVEVSAPGVVKEGNRPDDLRLRKMVEQGIKALTGAPDLTAAWKCLVNPGDVVGIKVNSWGGRLISTKSAMMHAAIDGVRMAGVPPERIVVWDQIESTLLEYVGDQSIEIEDLGVQFRGCTPGLSQEHYEEDLRPEGFATEPVEFGWGSVRVAELVAKELTAIINLGVLKDHLTSGISGALKNISHAIVDQPWRCHDNYCDPYIADIVNIGCVREKLRVHILDAVLGVAAGGPGLRSLAHLLAQERLLVSRDPVALDRMGYDWVVEAQQKKELHPSGIGLSGAPSKKGTPPAYIATAAERGLGTDDPRRIDLVRTTA